MASIISMWCGIFLGFELTKLFSICDFSVAKYSGKVIIIIIIIIIFIDLSAVTPSASQKLNTCIFPAGESGIEMLKSWLDTISATASNTSLIIVGTHLDKVRRTKEPGFPERMRQLLKELIQSPKYTGQINVVRIKEVSCAMDNREGKMIIKLSGSLVVYTSIVSRIWNIYFALHLCVKVAPPIDSKLI